MEDRGRQMPPGHDPCHMSLKSLNLGTVWRWIFSANPASFGMNLSLASTECPSVPAPGSQQAMAGGEWLPVSLNPSSSPGVRTLSKAPHEGRTQVSCTGAPYSPVAGLAQAFSHNPTWLVSCLRTVWAALPQKGGSKVDPGAASLERLETERKEMWRRQPLGFRDELIHKWSHSPWAFLAPPRPTSVHRLLPRGLPGNIFLVNVYIFGDSWFICGQSVPGKTHRAQPISGWGWPQAPGASDGQLPALGPGSSLLGPVSF